MRAPARDHTPATLVVFYLKQKESFQEDKVGMFVVLRFYDQHKKGQRLWKALRHFIAPKNNNKRKQELISLDRMTKKHIV